MNKYTKRVPRRTETQISKNDSIIGDSIEITVERLMEGEGEEGIEDRDLVYNDNETNIVNPITNIRSDKFDLMLDEKIGEYEHKHKKLKVIKDDENENNLNDTLDKTENTGE